MKWENLRKIFQEDEWLKRVVFSDEWLSDCNTEVEKDKRMMNWCECNLSHIMFRPFVGLNPMWRPKHVHTKLYTSDEEKSPFDEFRDWVSYQLVYKLVYELKRADGSVQTIVIPFEILNPMDTPVSFRWKAINLTRQLHKQPGVSVRWIALVRNICLMSRGDIMFNGYDVYKFPPGFNAVKSWLNFEKPNT